MYYQLNDNNMLINFSLHVNPLLGLNLYLQDISISEQLMHHTSMGFDPPFAKVQRSTE